jgi:hypothetical protein
VIRHFGGQVFCGNRQRGQKVRQRAAFYNVVFVFHGLRGMTHEHVKNNESVRDMLGQRGIQPEKLAAEEDLQRLERRVKSEEKKLAKQTKALPPREDKKDKP